MAKRGGENDLRITRERLRDRVLASFDGFEPCTAVEVAQGLGISTTSARDCLQELVADDELATKAVGDERVWYPTTAGSTVGGDDPAPAAIDERIDDAVAELSVPGTSEMMRSWRRDAVRAAVEFLRDESPATGAELTAAVYPSHRAGYEDPDEWWETVRAGLRDLPGVREGEAGWQFDPGRLGRYRGQ